MVNAALSPDTDRKLIELAISAGRLDPKAVDAVNSVRTQLIARGEAAKTLAEMLVDAGHLDRVWASSFLTQVRSARSEAAGATEHLEASGVPGYQITGDLGRGGMGRVYRARHLATGVERALKVMTLLVDPEAVARFQREVEALERATGEGVVRIHDSGAEGGRPWYAMALMPGGSLRQKLAGRGRLSWPEAVDIIAGVGSGLSRCHAAGIVHRDLKPENILFDGDDRPNLADFGCARDLATRDRLTMTGEILGTLDYMAPEQIEGQKVTAQADVHALGSILYELVTGEKAFPGATSPYNALVARDVIPSARSRVPEIPDALEGAIARAIARRPEDRFPSVAAFAEALSKVPRPVAVAGRRLPAIAVVLVLLGGAVLTAGIVASRARHDEHPGHDVTPVGTAAIGSRTDAVPALTAARWKELREELRIPRLPGIVDAAAVLSACPAADRRQLLDLAEAGLGHIADRDRDSAERCIALVRVLRAHGRDPRLPAWFLVRTQDRAAAGTGHLSALLVEALCLCVPADATADHPFITAIYELAGAETEDIEERRRALEAVSELSGRVSGPARPRVARACARYAGILGDFDRAVDAMARVEDDDRVVEDISTDLQKFACLMSSGEGARARRDALTRAIGHHPRLAVTLRWVRIFAVAGTGITGPLPEGDDLALVESDFEAVQVLKDERVWWAYNAVATIAMRRADSDGRARELFARRDALSEQPEDADRNGTELAPACLALLAGDPERAARILEVDRLAKEHAPEARAATTQEARVALARKIFPWRRWPP